MKKTLLLHVFLLSILYTSNSFAQGEKINKATVYATTKQIADTIAKYYVFPDLRKPIKNELISRLKSGRYDTLSTWQSYRKHITDEIREISNDKHLYVIYNPKTIEVLSNEVNRSQEEKDKYFQDLSRSNNFGFRKVEILTGNIGYLKISDIDFFSEESLETFKSAANFMEHAKAIIIDFRDNGGGGDDFGPVFISWFLKKDTPVLGFKTANNPKVQFGYTMSIIPVKRKLDIPLYILINKKTGSAAEAYTYILQNYKRSIVIGEASAGAANSSDEFTINSFLRLSVSTGAPVSPVTNSNWERIGVQPDIRCSSEKALDRAHLEALKKIGTQDANVQNLISELEKLK